MDALDTELEVREGVDRETVETVASMGTYKYGWNTDIEMDFAPKGLNEDIVRLISEKNNEPEWMLEWRLAAFARWVKMEEPEWAMVNYPKIEYQEQYYYAKPKSMAEKPKSLDDVDPKLLETYKKLGIPLKAAQLQLLPMPPQVRRNRSTTTTLTRDPTIGRRRPWLGTTRRMQQRRRRKHHHDLARSRRTSTPPGKLQLRPPSA